MHLQSLNIGRITGWALGCVALLWCGTMNAHAWVQSKTTGAQKPMSWYKLPIQYAIDAEGMGDFFTKNPAYGAPDSEFAAVDFSFKTWTDIVCPVGGAVGVSFQSLGRVSGKTVGADPDCGTCNINLVKFVRTGWTRSSMELAVALTAFRDLSGEIFDSDILVNAEHFVMTTQAENETDVKWDIQNAVTHEVGHLLGLAHSDVADATMFAKSGEGNLTLRTLEKDDVEGICTIYPPKQTIGNIPTYQEDSKDRGVGCHTWSEQSPVWWLLALGLCGLAWRRRRYPLLSISGESNPNR